jgi:hypothetical protein
VVGVRPDDLLLRHLKGVDAVAAEKAATGAPEREPTAVQPSGAALALTDAACREGYPSRSRVV